MYSNAFTSHTSSRHEISKGGMGRKGTTPPILCIDCQTVDHLIHSTKVYYNAFLTLEVRLVSQALFQSSGRAIRLLCPHSTPERQHPKFPPSPPTSHRLKIGCYFFLTVGEPLNCHDQQLELASSSLLASELSLAHVRRKAY